MYVYNCNSILTTEMNNRSDKEIIRAFTELTTDLKSRKINPGLHLMENESQFFFNDYGNHGYQVPVGYLR